MYRLLFFLVFIATSGLTYPAPAEISVPESVMASGGGRMTGNGQLLLATLGQGTVGTLSGAAHTVEVGFWHQYAHLVSDVTGGAASDGSAFALEHQSSNPARDVAVLQLCVPRACHASLRVYDVTGREVGVLVDGTLQAGCYDAHFASRGLPAGIYFCRLAAGGFVSTKRLVLIR